MNFVDYAEQVVGVNAPWQEVNDLDVELETQDAERIACFGRIRRLEEQIAYEEQIIVGHERGTYQGSMTAFKDHIKTVLATAPDLIALRNKLYDERELHDTLEGDVHRIQYRIRSLNSRMVELGGYFYYLAVNKEVSANRPTS